MNTQSNQVNTFENISFTQRVSRFVISMIAIVVAMTSPLAGGYLFALINLLAIGLATSAIIGWDPVYALKRKQSKKLSGYVPQGRHDLHRGHHA